MEDLAISAEYRVKIRENEKRDRCMDFARELKTLWSMKVTLMPIVIGAFGTIPKGLDRGLEELEIRERLETTKSTTLHIIGHV